MLKKFLIVSSKKLGNFDQIFNSDMGMSVSTSVASFVKSKHSDSALVIQLRITPHSDTTHHT